MKRRTKCIPRLSMLRKMHFYKLQNMVGKESKGVIYLPPLALVSCVPKKHTNLGSRRSITWILILVFQARMCLGLERKGLMSFHSLVLLGEDISSYLIKLCLIKRPC